MSVTAEDLARRAAALADRASGERPTSWRPDKLELEHPNPLVGVLLGVVDGPDRGYGPTRIAELRDVEGREWALWLLGHVLRQEFLELASAPQPGELVAVRYGGRRKRASARVGEPAEYESYRVVVDRDGANDGEQAAERAERPSERPAEAPATRDEGSRMPGYQAPEAVCEQCGYPESEHAPGCLPF
jgi:hypothetical protein